MGMWNLPRRLAVTYDITRFETEARASLPDAGVTV